ncbi:3-keto-disaccharide hydrolase [Planctomicrobium sp. SH527]|uniref:3-keto-disaccharide hydrolase n=1 Tax=Planctomicrobium sp. SH527 TaxID=3448123 RepID=UPI003F5C7C25
MLKQMKLVAILFFSLGSIAQSAEPPEGFRSIFNGKDLSGWEGSDEYWSVKDGCLTGTTDGSLKYNRFIIWRDGTLKNFELRVQVKVTPGGNSGLNYRSQHRPDLGEGVVTGYQCDVVSNRADYNGMLYEERGRRILAHSSEKVIIDPAGQPWVVGEFPLKEFPSGEWHNYRVVVRGNHHQHWIDDHPTTDVIDLDEKGRALDGILGVQVHVGPAMQIQYRNMFLKHLPDDLPIIAAEEAPIPPTAVKVVPQGKDKPKQVPKEKVAN